MRSFAATAGASAALSAAQKSALREGLDSAASRHPDLASVFSGIDDAQLDAEFQAYSKIRDQAKKEKWDDHKLTQELYLWRVKEFRAKLEKVKSKDVAISEEAQAEAIAALASMQGADDALGVPKAEVNVDFPNKVKLGDF